MWVLLTLSIRSIFFGLNTAILHLNFWSAAVFRGRASFDNWSTHFGCREQKQPGFLVATMLLSKDVKIRTTYFSAALVRGWCFVSDYGKQVAQKYDMTKGPFTKDTFHIWCDSFSAYISTDFGHKNTDGNGNIVSEGRKMELSLWLSRKSEIIGPRTPYYYVP